MPALQLKVLLHCVKMVGMPLLEVLHVLNAQLDQLVLSLMLPLLLVEQVIILYQLTKLVLFVQLVIIALLRVQLQLCALLDSLQLKDKLLVSIVQQLLEM